MKLEHLIWAACLSALSAAAAAAPWRPVDPLDHRDRERMVEKLLKQVVYVSAKPIPTKGDAFKDEVQDGFGVAIAPRRIVCLNFIVDKVASVSVRGPIGKPIAAKVLLHDVERRVAVLEPEADVKTIGIEVASVSRAKDRSVDQPVFALSATIEPYLLDGVLTDLGHDSEVEGLLLSDLRLAKGMPVFDDRARFVGYSRTVEWDSNRLLIISTEVIESARTATKAAASVAPAPKKPPKEAPSGWIRRK